jgi:hypothetical protein
MSLLTKGIPPSEETETVMERSSALCHRPYQLWPIYDAMSPAWGVNLPHVISLPFFVKLPPGRGPTSDLSSGKPWPSGGAQPFAIAAGFVSGA